MFLPIVLITLSVFSHTTAAACRSSFKEDLRQEHPPLFLTPYGGRYELLKPTGSFFEWNHGETVVVACSTAKNVLSNTRTGHMILTCIDGHQFGIPGTTGRTSLGSIECSSTVSGAIYSLNVPCANGAGTLYDIGFEVKGLPFVKYFQTCYNLAKSSAIYSEHQLLGNVLSHAQTNNKRPAFKQGGIPSTVSFATVYTQRHQMNRFTTLLGSSAQASKYIDSNSYLAKGHLTPDADAILHTWASSTYFFINAAPEWQIINGGNWLRVENAARKVAIQLNDTLQVYTGVYDVLDLLDQNNNPVPMSLGEDGTVEVPKWLWKVVVHPKSNSAIVLITLNNPFANGGQTLCENICARHGWHQKEFQDVKKGFTYCCRLPEAQKAIRVIPKSITSRHILEYN